MLELLDRLIVLLDERRQGTEAPANVDGAGRVGDVERGEEAGETGVGLELLVDLRDLRAREVSTYSSQR